MSISLACAPHRAFQRQLTETLCCPKKSIFFCKSAVLSHKNQKNNLFQSRSPRGPRTSKDCFFLGQYSTFARNLPNPRDCTTKTTLFFAKVLYCPKKSKKNNCSSLGAREVPGPQKIGYFGTVQHFCRKLDKNAVLSQKTYLFGAGFIATSNSWRPERNP